MYADDFPQSPKQVTVTQVWHTTRKHGRDDEEIEATRLKVAAERKAARNKNRSQEIGLSLLLLHFRKVKFPK